VEKYKKRVGAKRFGLWENPDSKELFENASPLLHSKKQHIELFLSTMHEKCKTA